jgi:hypothetical protein
MKINIEKFNFPQTEARLSIDMEAPKPRTKAKRKPRA